MKFLFFSTAILALLTVIFNFVSRKTKCRKFSTFAIVFGGLGSIMAILGYLLSAGYITV